MKRAPVIIVLAALLLGACSTTPQKQELPEWIEGSSSKFPSALYLTGRGIAGSADDARDRARSDLAKQFEVAVSERSQQSQAYSRTQQQGEVSETLEQQVSRDLATSTSRTLQGVEIAEQWRDRSTRQYHALAVLSRSLAQQQFEQQIDALDNNTSQKLTQAESEQNGLTRAALIQQAIALQQQRIAAQSALQVADPSGHGRPPVLAIGELQRSRDAIINQTRIATNVTGEYGGDLQQQLSSAASAAGFFFDEANADYVLTVTTRLDPPLLQQGWYWLRGTLELTMKDKNGNDAGVKRWPLKASSTTLEQTRQRLLSDTNTILSQALRETVLGFGIAPEKETPPAKK